MNRKNRLWKSFFTLLIAIFIMTATVGMRCVGGNSDCGYSVNYYPGTNTTHYAVSCNGEMSSGYMTGNHEAGLCRSFALLYEDAP